MVMGSRDYGKTATTEIYLLQDSGEITVEPQDAVHSPGYWGTTSTDHMVGALDGETHFLPLGNMKWSLVLWGTEGDGVAVDGGGCVPKSTSDSLCGGRWGLSRIIIEAAPWAAAQNWPAMLNHNLVLTWLLIK